MAQRVYTSRGIVLMKQALGEASVSALVLTEEFGLLRLRAQSARRSDAKMRYALEPMTLGQYSFVRGVQANRLIGTQVEMRLLNIDSAAARLAEGHISRLLLRLLPGEEGDPALFSVVCEGFRFMTSCDAADIPDAECMLVLSILAKLGYLSEDATLTQFADAPLTEEHIERMRTLRPQAVRAINHALSISGL